MAIQAFPHFIGVRLSKTEMALLQRMVAQEKSTLSAMVRECIVRESVRPLFAKAAEGEEHDAASM